MAAQDEPHTPPPLPDLEDVADESAHPIGRGRKSLGKRVMLVAAIAFLTVTAAILLNALIGPSGMYAPLGGPKEKWDAQSQTSIIEQAIYNYLLTNKKLPTSLKELTETSDRDPHPFIESIPDDPWGNPYVYRIIGRNKFDLRSAGEDGVPDTEDDITARDY